MARRRRPDRPRRLASTRPSPRSTPTRPARIEGTRELPRVDAGARRPHPRRHGRHALRHPRADPAHRVLHRADQRRRHLLHRPQRGLRPPRPDVVVGARRHRRASPPGARSPPSSTRACPATTSRSPRRPTARSVLNRWQRLMCWVSGHGEGWALYAERLMDELGYLDDPGDKLGMLDGQGFRAARVDRRHRHAPRAGDPARQPVRLPPGRDVDPDARPGVHAPALPDGGRVHPVRGQPLPRLAGPGAVVQGRRADLAAGPRGGPGPPRRRLRPQGVPPRRARPRLARPRPAAGRRWPASRDPAGPGVARRRPGWPPCAPPASTPGGGLGRRRVAGDRRPTRPTLASSSPS